MALKSVKLNKQEPESIVLGSTNKWTGYGEKRVYKPKNEVMMYVPLTHTIQTLLQDSSISNEVKYVTKTLMYILIYTLSGQKVSYTP